MAGLLAPTQDGPDLGALLQHIMSAFAPQQQAQAAPQAPPVPMRAPQAAPVPQGLLGGQPQAQASQPPPIALHDPTATNNHNVRDRWISLALGGVKGLKETYGAQSQARQAAEANHHAAGQLNEMADALQLTGRERALFLMSPDKWAEATAKQYEPYTLSGGQTHVGQAGNYTAPLVHPFDDRFGVGTVGADGQISANYSDPRGPTAAETETQRHNRADEGLSGGRLRVEQGRLGLEGQRFARTGAKGGGKPAKVPTGFILDGH